jgi:crotonobetaine/carnitine-CoA ligase
MSAHEAMSFAAVVARRAESGPDGELVRMAGSPGWTAGALWRHSLEIAGGLADHVRPGETVATSLPPSPEAIAVTTALSALGAVEMPLGPDVDQRWARTLARSAGCVTTLASTGALDSSAFLGDLGQHRTVPTVSVGGRHPGAVPLEELVASGRRVSPRRQQAGDPALVMTTSGTTGRVKGAMLPVGAGPGQAMRVQRAMRYCSSDVLYSFFPWHHINARHAAFLPAVLGDARLVLDTRFSASRFVDRIRSEGVTAFNFMGAVCAMLLRQPPTSRDRDHLVTRAYGGPAPAPLVQAMQERFGITLLQAYACTELGDVSTTAVDEILPGAAGRPVPEYAVRVVDESGDDVPPGEVGELLVRPEQPHLTFLSYVGDAAATSRAWRDGWFRTGDRGRLEDGWLFFEGRSADVVRRRGVNISPDVVEEAISTMPGVSDVAVVGVPSELTEDEVLAIVVPAPDHDLDPVAVREHCIGRLPRHAIPRFVSVQQSIPHNASLKVSRAHLRQRGLPANAWDAESPAHPPVPTEVP